MNAKRVIAAFSVVSVVLFAGCTKLPVNEVNNAKAQYQKAQKADAEIFAKEEFAKAKAVYDSAIEEISKQKKSLPFFRSYGRSVQLFTEAAKGFVSAGSVAAENKTNFTKDADSLTKQASQDIEEINAFCKKSPKANKQVNDIKKSLEAKKSLYDEAFAALSSGNLIVAKNKLESYVKELEALKATLTGMTSAKAKGKGKKK